MQRILGDDARRDAHVLSVSAIIEEQVFAKILLVALAEVALPARRRVDRHDAIASGLNPVTPIAHLGDAPRPVHSSNSAGGWIINA